MPSLPSPIDDYKAPPDLELSRAVWDAVLGSIGTRLRALEGVSADFDALIALGTSQALDVISTNVEPQLTAMSAAVAALQADVAEAEDVITALISGSVPASAVAETADRIWFTPALATALAGKQAGDPTLTALAAVTVAANKLIYANGPDAFAVTDLSAFARTLLDDADAGTMRGTIGAASASQTVTGIGLASGGGDLSANRTINVPIADQSEAEAGAINNKAMTPQRVAQAVAAQTAEFWAYTRPLNRHLNPAFSVNQDRALGATVDITASSVYVMDGVIAGRAASPGVLRCSQQAVNAGAHRSPRRLRAACQTTDTSIASGDLYFVALPVEGIFIADAGFGQASPATLTWRGMVKLPAGTYGLSFANDAQNRCYVTTFTVAAGEANTDKYVSVTIPGDASGTWIADTSGRGITVRICLAAGSDYQAPVLDAWQSGNYYRSPTQANFMASNGNVFELSDIGLYVLDWDPYWWMPDSALELVRCQRYFQNVGAGIVGVAASSSQAECWVQFATQMRASPSISFVTGAMVEAATSGRTATGVGLVAVSIDGCSFNATGMSGLTSGKVLYAAPAGYLFSASARL